VDFQEKPLLVPVIAIDPQISPIPTEVFENQNKAPLPVAEVSVASADQEVIVHLTPTKSEKGGRRRSHGGRQRYHKKRRPEVSTDVSSPSSEVVTPPDTQRCTEE
jgi:hypothetical protein